MNYRKVVAFRRFVKNLFRMCHREDTVLTSLCIVQGLWRRRLVDLGDGLEQLSKYVFNIVHLYRRQPNTQHFVQVHLLQPFLRLVCSDPIYLCKSFLKHGDDLLKNFSRKWRFFEQNFLMTDSQTHRCWHVSKTDHFGTPVNIIYTAWPIPFKTVHNFSSDGSTNGKDNVDNVFYHQ